MQINGIKIYATKKIARALLGKIKCRSCGEFAWKTIARIKTGSGKTCSSECKRDYEINSFNY